VSTYQLSSMFCHEFASFGFVQVPPKETAGLHHFIPNITNGDIVKSLKLLIVPTEDSISVTVRGEYDKLDAVANRNEDVRRDLQVGQVGYFF